MASQRQTILDYLAETLFPAITTGGGFNFTVATSQRGLRSFHEMVSENFPALFVASADEEREDRTGRHFQSQMRVVIYGAVKASDGGQAGEVQKQLDMLIEDVTKKLYTDPSQGGRTSWTKVKTVVTDEGNEHPYAFFRMEVEFMYMNAGVTP